MSSNFSDKSLTKYLVSNEAPLAAATRHTFLTSAGNGTLNQSLLALWLSQDRIYIAHAYPRFIGLLIAKIPFRSSERADSPEEQHNQRILKLLVGCLENALKELAFFDQTSKDWNLDVNCWRERKGTKDYTAEMMRVASIGSLDEGLLFLWAMEKVYLDAWKYAAVIQSQTSNVGSSNAAAPFISNWSTPAFEEFVDVLADVADHLNTFQTAEGWKRAMDLWKRVVEIETLFWPKEGEETSMTM